MLQFQLLSATLEDRHPPGYAASERSEVVDNPKDVAAIALGKAQEGCIAYLFGRTEDGTSVVLRQEGVFPKLYFRMAADEALGDVRRSLEALVEHALRYTKGLRATEVRMAHCSSFEPDAAAPSGRVVHRYAEVSYPNLASFRAMRRLQREADARTLRDATTRAARRLEEIKARLTDASRRAMRGGPTESEGGGDAYRALEAEQKHLVEHVLPALHEKRRLLCGDDGGKEADEVDEVDEVDEAKKKKRTGHRYPHEHFVEPMSRHLQEEGLSPGRWYAFALDRPCATPVSLCDREYAVASGGLTPVDREDVSPYLTCYYDIETTSLDPTTHPVIQVSLVFERGEAGEAGLDRHVVVLHAVDEAMLPDVTCHTCNDEAEVLEAFARIVREHDPDFVVAYNGVNFDNHFLAARAERLGVDNFFHLSRFAMRRTRLRELSLSSNGMGDNLFRYFDMPGRQTLDWFVKLKRDLTSEPSYALNHFARTICGDRKKDMDHREIPVLQAGTDRDRARLTEYCVHDSVLLARLNAARTMVIEIVQFAAVFGIVPEWVYFRGQQVRFISQLLRKVRTLEAVPMLLDVPDDGFVGADEFGKFTGATVNDPKVGFYKVPVIVVDWLSLYPNIMIGHNLCHSTHVPRARVAALVADGWEVVPPSTAPTRPDRAIVAHDVGDGKTTHFVAATVRCGILPHILREQAAARTTAKAKQKDFARRSKAAADDPALQARLRTLASVCDGQQKAMKTSMNSIYGACGANAGKYPNRDISSTVTAEGRRAMVVKKRILPERYPGVTVVYGDTDSIMMTFDDVATVAEARVRGHEVERFVTDYFATVLRLPTMVIEFEKVFYPYLQQGKKRYAGRKFEPGDGDAMVDKGIDCKGLETERKDTLPFTKEIMTSVFDAIMDSMDEHRALALFEAHMQRLVDDEVPFEHYIMKKNLSAKVVHKTDSIVQAKVNKDRRDREAGSEAATGEQVEYVITNGYKRDKTTQLAQDPTYAREQGLKPNRLWYFEHAIEEPVRKIFSAFPNLPFKSVCDRYRSILDSKRLNVGDALRKVIAEPGAAGGGGADAGGAAIGAAHVPRPPPSRPAKRKKLVRPQ